jgi:hypothetical protein
MTDTQFSNEFGSVHSDRVAFNAKKGWFGGGISEDLPIRHVTSVRHETTRSPILGIILILCALGAFSAGEGAAGFIGIILLALGVLLLLGWPSVTINTSGNDLRRATGGIWQKEAAEEFVSAVKKALFAKP